MIYYCYGFSFDAASLVCVKLVSQFYGVLTSLKGDLVDSVLFWNFTMIKLISMQLSKGELSGIIPDQEYTTGSVGCPRHFHPGKSPLAYSPLAYRQERVRFTFNQINLIKFPI